MSGIFKFITTCFYIIPLQWQVSGLTPDLIWHIPGEEMSRYNNGICIMIKLHKAKQFMYEETK